MLFAEPSITAGFGVDYVSSGNLENCVLTKTYPQGKEKSSEDLVYSSFIRLVGPNPLQALTSVEVSCMVKKSL